MSVTTLTLVHASKSRGGVLWSKDEYDVYDGERRVIGRIMRKRGRIVHGSGRSPPADAYHRCRVVVTRQAANWRWPISRRDGIAPSF